MKITDIYVFAVNEFNEPLCDGVSNASATATLTGPWTHTASNTSSSDYLTASLQGSTIDPSSASVVFTPNLRQSGNYSVTIFTPGCLSDDTCSTRGRVNITGVMAATGTATPAQPVSTELFQTNNYDKYDQVYFGYVDATSGSFQPSVTLAPSSGQSGPLTVVAQRIRFELVSTTGGLNGLFEYNPNQAVVDTDFTKSAINMAGEDLGSNAVVNTLIGHGGSLFVGGNFSADSNNFSNIFSVGTGDPVSLPGAGLNGQVHSFFLNGTSLYVVGEFSNTRNNNTEGLNGVALFDVTASVWHALGAGVNGIVYDAVPLYLNLTANQPELCVVVSGMFDQILGFGSNAAISVSSSAIWVPSRNNWLQNLDVAGISLQGNLAAATDVPGYSAFFGGSVSSQAFGVSDAVGLTQSDASLALERVPVRIRAQTSSTSSLQRRALTAQNVTGAVTGLMYGLNDLNITILGGHFAATATDGSTINNLLFINGSNSARVTGLGNELVADSTILALGTQGTTLFAGGSISGTASGNDVTGLLTFDLVAGNYTSSQPEGLVGDSVSVNAIAPQPNTQAVFIGGNFDSAGEFACPTLCVFDTTRSQWISPGAGLQGVISAMTWVDDTHLLIAGNLTANSTTTNVVRYDSGARSFTSVDGASGLPGPVTALSAATQDGSQYWIAGTDNGGAAYLQKFDGTNFAAAANDVFGQGTVIRGLQVFSLTENHATSDLVPQNEALLILGDLQINNFGAASAALYNGTTVNPFLLSTSDNGGGSLAQAFVQFPSNFFEDNCKWSPQLHSH